jgi:hypothetical protein
MSAPTRLDAETALYGRLEGALLFVYQRDADPQTGTFPLSNQPVTPSNSGPTPIYTDPLGYGLRQSGSPAASPVSVTDADVAAAVGNWDMFMDLSEYRMAVSLLNSFTDVTESDFGRSVSYNQYADRLQKRIDALTTQYLAFLTPFRYSASSGVIRHTPPTATVPRYGPGYNGRNRGGYYGGGFGGYGGGWGGW